MEEFKHEFDYPGNNYQNLGPKPSSEMCKSCESYYAKLFEQGHTKTPFPPNCSKHVLQAVENLALQTSATEDEILSMLSVLDPVTWALEELNWKATWYQDWMLSCTCLIKLYRMGRRTGKTSAMVVESLHHCFTNKAARVLVVAPRESQIVKFFEDLTDLIKNSKTMMGSCSATKSPPQVDFKNGSRIKGFILNPNAGADSAVSIRGQDASLIIADEVNFMSDKDLDVLAVIRASKPNCKMIVSSTPTGDKNKFYKMVVDKNIGWKEFWIIASESPRYTPEVDKFFKDQFSEEMYRNEVLAEFGQSEDGVFKSKYIDLALYEYDMEVIEPEQGHQYIMGVDWNKSSGTHIVILQLLNDKLKLIKKIIIPESEYTQTNSVEKIIELNDTWNFKYIFVDNGYGSTQVEMIKKYGLKNPSSKLHDKIKPLVMNTQLKIKDHFSGEITKKFMKPFIVQQTVKMFEEGKIILPKSEDEVGTIKEEGSNKVEGLVVQLRAYKIIGYSVYKMPTYTKEDEHTLSAFVIACGGYVLETDELFSNPEYVTTVYGIEVNSEIVNGNVDVNSRVVSPETSVNAMSQKQRENISAITSSKTIAAINRGFSEKERSNRSNSGNTFKRKNI